MVLQRKRSQGRTGHMIKYNFINAMIHKKENSKKKGGHLRDFHALRCSYITRARLMFQTELFVHLAESLFHRRALLNQNSHGE